MSLCIPSRACSRPRPACSSANVAAARPRAPAGVRRRTGADRRIGLSCRAGRGDRGGGVADVTSSLYRCQRIDYVTATYAALSVLADIVNIAEISLHASAARGGAERSAFAVADHVVQPRAWSASGSIARRLGQAPRRRSLYLGGNRTALTISACVDARAPPPACRRRRTHLENRYRVTSTTRSSATTR